MILAEIGYNQRTHDEAVNWVISQCRDLKPVDIGKVIDKLVQTYYNLYQVSINDINCGLCQDFAQDLVNIFQERWGYELDSYWGDDLLATELNLDWEDVPYIDAHCFVFFEGKYYDSECSEGVVDWKQLPIFDGTIG
jgi:hypothetical protein